MITGMDDLCHAAEIARRLGVSRQRVSILTRRADFPVPVTPGRWRWSDVAAWHATRTRARSPGSDPRARALAVLRDGPVRWTTLTRAVGVPAETIRELIAEGAVVAWQTPTRTKPQRWVALGRPDTP